MKSPSTTQNHPTHGASTHFPSTSPISPPLHPYHLNSTHITSTPPISPPLHPYHLHSTHITSILPSPRESPQTIKTPSNTNNPPLLLPQLKTFNTTLMLQKLSTHLLPNSTPNPTSSIPPQIRSFQTVLGTGWGGGGREGVMEGVA